MKIALTGGIACGKSLVAKFLNELGVETLDADDVVHELIPADERKRLAAKVFSDPAARKALEARIHPIVRERIESWEKVKVKGEGEQRRDNDSAVHLSSSPSPLRVAVIPLLFEVHWEKDFDILLCVTSKRETQVARMMTARGYSREEAEARLAAQLPVEEKAAKSHYAIENDGSPDELRAKVAAMVEWLKERVTSVEL